MALQRAAANQIHWVEAHRRPPLRLGVPRHYTVQMRAHRAIIKCPEFLAPPREGSRRGAGERAHRQCQGASPDASGGAPVGS
jgi:hypothetical protein